MIVAANEDWIFWVFTRLDHVVIIYFCDILICNVISLWKEIF
jgi:hypothetical protein